jgi:hypothetical protein
MRRWNLGVHIDRNHVGSWNPVKYLKSDKYNDARTKLANNSDSLLPNFDLTGPFQPTLKLQNLKQQIKGLSRFELTILLQAVINEINRPS